MSTANSLAETTTQPPCALIAGPTASGKSLCAVQLALALQARGKPAVVINADSAQLYADLAVLSARPSPEEMQGVVHRLFGEWDGAQACSAADWAARAREVVAEVHAAGGVPILAGGTGLYLNTLIEGIAPIPPIDPAVRVAVRSLPVAQAYAALQTEDPGRAARLAPADSTRIARALEVVRSTGHTLAHWQEQRSGGIGPDIKLHPLLLLPPREWLYERCDRRFAQMLDQGAIAEVETLLARGLDPDLPVMRAIGVPEIVGTLLGDWDLAEARSRAQQATRNYAKRQFTWFRRQLPEQWPRMESVNYDIEAIFASLLRN